MNDRFSDPVAFGRSIGLVLEPVTRMAPGRLKGLALARNNGRVRRDQWNSRPKNPRRACFTAAASRASHRSTMPIEAFVRSFAISSFPVCASPNAIQSPTVQAVLAAVDLVRDGDDVVRVRKLVQPVPLPIGAGDQDGDFGIFGKLGMVDQAEPDQPAIVG
jgi:hypothetical protein